MTKCYILMISCYFNKSHKKYLHEFYSFSPKKIPQNYPCSVEICLSLGKFQDVRVIIRCWVGMTSLITPKGSRKPKEIVINDSVELFGKFVFIIINKNVFCKIRKTSK